MPKINLLDRETAELIAAGEVIERPASVVKELVENAIDAGATAITVEIQNGGVRLIRVTDNGCGIEREDVPKAFLRHATSKVLNAVDLERIGTLGFRGEALASICAVSETEILTCTAEEEIGTRYTLAGECAGELAEAGCPVGTTITVRNLFYNVPARMKFLKKDSTEGSAIATLLDRLALSHPEIAFRFIREKETKLNTPGSGDLLSAIYAVYGNEFGRSLIPVECESGPYRVSGYLARPETCRASRSMEHFFINRRYVKCMTMLAAVEEAYRNHLMSGKYPGCVIDLTLDPSQVDVNVHPAKLEVKLSDERSVFDVVYNACKGALNRMDRAVPVKDVASRRFSDFELHHKPAEGTQTRMSAEEYRALAQKTEQKTKAPLFTGTVSKPAAAASHNVLHSDTLQSYQKNLPPKGTVYGAAEQNNPPKKWEPVTGKKEEPEVVLPPRTEYRPKPAAPVAEVAKPAAPVSIPVSKPAEPPKSSMAVEEKTESEKTYKLLGEVFATYLLVESGDELLMIDKHAAHERIYFNRLKRQHEEGTVERQLLLTPQTIMLSKELYNTVLQHTARFDQAGFAVEDFGDGCIRVREVPAVLAGSGCEDLILELAERILRGTDGGEESLFDDLYHSVACKAAIKGNRPSNMKEQEELLRLLKEDPTVRNCPHGRPVIVVITRREMEKMFGRIV